MIVASRYCAAVASRSRTRGRSIGRKTPPRSGRPFGATLRITCGWWLLPGRRAPLVGYRQSCPSQAPSSPSERASFAGPRQAGHPAVVSRARGAVRGRHDDGELRSRTRASARNRIPRKRRPSRPNGSTRTPSTAASGARLSSPARAGTTAASAGTRSATRRRRSASRRCSSGSTVRSRDRAR